MPDEVPEDPEVRSLLLILTIAAAAVSRCEESPSATPTRDPRPGEFVRLRGTLGEDVDCRLLRTEGGKTYSLSVRLRNYVNGTRLCVHGTVAEVSPCLTQPMLEVQQIRSWSSCP